MCQQQHTAFMARYGFLTRSVRNNIYAIAAESSLVDFGTYLQVLRADGVQFIECEQAEELGLRHVEGAVLTGERHIIIREARRFFEGRLKDRICYDGTGEPNGWDWTIDCTFCARDAERIDRYEPCITGLLEGPVDRAVTIMDGPFPSLYPWDAQSRNGPRDLNSLTSAKFTPLGRCKTYEEARSILETLTVAEADNRIDDMRAQLAVYWPESLDLYRPALVRFGIRAMPRSGADARLVDIVQPAANVLRVRAGKIDAILHAEKLIKEFLCLP